MISFWERASFAHYDHIIVGGGIVGLSAAIELATLDNEASVMVLERGLLPTGASTRNAGFACMGSATELADDLKHTSADAVVELFAQRKAGLELLRSRLGDDAIGYEANGGYEVLTEKELWVLEQLPELNALLRTVTGKAAFEEQHERVGEFGFGKNVAKGLIQNTCEGAIHTGKMMKALYQKAIASGVTVLTGAELTQYEEGESSVQIWVQGGVRQMPMKFSCQSLSFCTNAFTGRFFPGEDVVPGRGQVLVTQPVPGLKLKGIFHLDEGYYYFREIAGRVLIGGGRNLEFEGERTTEIEVTERIQQALEEKLKTLILPYTTYEVDMRWAGIMAFGATKRPIVKAMSERVYGAFRMGGMGVALGSTAAQQLAIMIAKK